MIKLENLTKTYFGKGHKTEALKGINLEIRKGDFTAIMGASGSGKSTLLNILGCIDDFTAGNYYFKDVDVKTLNNKKLAKLRNREIGYIFQAFNLIDDLNIIENVEMPLGYGGVKAKERKKVATDSEIILADEPTGNLDSKTGEEVMEILKKLNNEGTTIILVTHDKKVAEYANRLIVLKDGEISEDSYK
ncbi:MAG: macrolide transporter ATP-binding protein [Clostridiales bacterium]|nr:macrolide transporter ATP-binding protein [Clostridiales bacterium]